MKVAAIQIAPVFLDKTKTWQKLRSYIISAAEENANLITWGETLLPGYPQWLSASGGAQFNDTNQKTVYRKYWQEALTLNDPIIEEMKTVAKEYKINLMGGIAERSSGSIYATLITIDENGVLLGRHRKIKPTYEERMVWADGDAKGLKTYELHGMNVGGLNCWENWLPYARAALHRQDEFLHIAVWPGSIKLTKDVTRFIALEGRYWVVSVSGILRKEDFSHLDVDDFPMKELMEEKNSWQNGGSMIVNPRGDIVAGPFIDEEGIIYADINREMVIEERQNMDYSGHYSRFDIFELNVKD